jgi:hypothetical protein
MDLQNSIPFCVGLYVVIALFPIEIWSLMIKPSDSILLIMGICFLKFNPQKLINAVEFNWIIGYISYIIAIPVTYNKVKSD